MSSAEDGGMDHSRLGSLFRAAHHRHRPRAMPRMVGAKSPLSVGVRAVLEVQGECGVLRPLTSSTYAIALDLAAPCAAAAVPRATDTAPYAATASHTVTSPHALHLKLAGQTPLRFPSAAAPPALRVPARRLPGAPGAPLRPVVIARRRGLFHPRPQRLDLS